METILLQKILQTYLINKLGYTPEQAFNTSYADTIRLAQPFLFDFDYPIYDINHKEELQTKICKRYYKRNIALETVELFKLFLDDKLNIIMPYYNQLYATEALKIEPLMNHVYTDTKTIDGRTTGTVDNRNTTTQATTGTTTETGSGDNVHKEWEQPQSGDLVNDSYLTRQVSDSATSQTGSTQKADTTKTDSGQGLSEGTINQTDSRIFKGTLGTSQAKLLMEYRQAILNIDEMIVKEMTDLFYGLM